MQFEQKETASKALTTGQFELGGRPVYVKKIEVKREVKSMVAEGQTYQQQAQEIASSKAVISAEHQRRRDKKLNAKAHLKQFLVQNVQ